MPKQVVVGAPVVVECDFRVAGVLTDPLAVVSIVKSPAGDTTTYTYPTAGLSRDSTGVYHVQFVATTAGSYWVRFEGSGVVEAVNEESVSVLASNVL